MVICALTLLNEEKAGPQMQIEAQSSRSVVQIQNIDKFLKINPFSITVKNENGSYRATMPRMIYANTASKKII